MKQAADQDLKTIGLSGKDGGRLAMASDVSITVPAASTARIQECHIAIGHILCELVELISVCAGEPPEGRTPNLLK